MLDGKADATRVRDDGGPAPGRDQRNMARLDVDGRAESRRDLLYLAQKSFGVRSRDPHACSLRQRHDGVLHSGAVAALLGKARGNDDGVLDAYGRALLQRAKYRARRDNDDSEIDRRTHVRDRFVAFDAVDIGVVRIDRIDLSGILVLAQHREQPPRNLLEVARGPDQRDAFRREKTVERMRHASIVLSVQGIVIASAAKQSISRHKGRMDCFAALAMTVE